MFITQGLNHLSNAPSTMQLPHHQEFLPLLLVLPMHLLVQTANLPQVQSVPFQLF